VWWQIRNRSQLEINSGATRPTSTASVRIVVEGSAHNIDDRPSTAPVSPLAAIARKISSHRSFRQQDTMLSTLPTTGLLKLNTRNSATICAQATSSNEDATTEGSRVFCRDVTGTCRLENTPDRDDITVSTFSPVDAISAGSAGSRPVDNSGDVSLTTPTSGSDDNGEVRVRFRFDSVSCPGVDQNDVTSTLPKEPHPVRDQTVCRRSDDATRHDPPRSESLNNIRLNLPSTSGPRLQRSVSETTEESSNELATSRLRWPFSHRPRGRQRQKPSSALKKEIKAARQLGVIMGAFTVCFLPYFVCMQEDHQEPTIVVISHLHTPDKRRIKHVSRNT